MTIADVCLLAGFGLTIAGLCLLSVPLGLCVAGIWLFAAGAALKRA